MKTIWYEDITDVLLSIADPNTWWAISEVPWVSAPKINATTSIYNVEADGGIAWWSTDITWSAANYRTVSWGNGHIYMPDWTTLTVSSWNTGNMTGMTYIYYDMSTNSVATTTSASACVWENKLLLCVASPTTSWKDAEFQAFGTGYQSTFIYADNIASNTITANEIASNAITTAKLDAWAVTAAKIDAWAVTTSKIAVKAVGTWELDDWAVTADKISVSTLSAITANLWDVHVWATSGSGAWIRIYPNSSTDGRMDFYYNGSVMGRMVWGNYSWVWNAVLIYWWTGSGTIWLLGTTICVGKLRIPVWTDLYE